MVSHTIKSISLDCLVALGIELATPVLPVLQADGAVQSVVVVADLPVLVLLQEVLQGVQREEGRGED